MGQASVEERFPVPPDRVYAALEQVAREVGKTVEGADPATRTVYFNTGLSWSSWTGQNVTAAVIDDQAGGSLVRIDAKLAKRGMSSFQLIDWGESRRVAGKVVKALHRHLGTAA
jgi:hypothetical protein